ncbi:MAG TPA: hypothetical protein PKZ32_06625, partial [Candidatus Melainabacteria bacterium]|nr:hypothetical protein [Candidatus Melainabacteria bacterium]
MQPFHVAKPHLSPVNMNKSINAIKNTLADFPGGRLALCALACTFLPLAANVPVLADEEILLKPDVPKMDMPVEAPKKTLKGNVQHSHKQADPNRKPFS